VGTNTEQISICISALELASSFGAYYVAAMSLKYEPKLSNNQACGQMPKRKFAYRVRNGQMGGRCRKNIISEVSEIIDFSTDDSVVDDFDSDNTYHMLPSEEESDNEEEAQCADTKIKIMLKVANKIEKRWRTENNTNLRGRGTSRSTFYVQQNKANKLLESGRQTKQIGSFFTAPLNENGQQLVASAPAVSFLSSAEPAIVESITDGNETDDELTFGVSVVNHMKVMKISKDKEIEKMRKAISKLLSDEACVTRSRRIEKKKDTMTFKVGIVHFTFSFTLPAFNSLKFEYSL
jgi:hypothetical protein